MNILSENMTIDELLAELAQSSDQNAVEISRRMSGSRYGNQSCDKFGARGRTVHEIKEHGESVVVRFTDGAYIVIDTEVYDGVVEFCVGRPLINSERFYLNMMSPEESADYAAQKKAAEEAEKEHRIERLRRELEKLEAQS